MNESAPCKVDTFLAQNREERARREVDAGDDEILKKMMNAANIPYSVQRMEDGTAYIKILGVCGGQTHAPVFVFGPTHRLVGFQAYELPLTPAKKGDEISADPLAFSENIDPEKDGGYDIYYDEWKTTHVAKDDHGRWCYNLRVGPNVLYWTLREVNEHLDLGMGVKETWKKYPILSVMDVALTPRFLRENE